MTAAGARATPPFAGRGRPFGTVANADDELRGKYVAPVADGPLRSFHRRHDGRRSIQIRKCEVIPVSNTSISGVVSVSMPCTEKSVLGYGEAWFQHGSRPRPDAFLTLDPTQRPSAPRRWGT